MKHIRDMPSPIQNQILLRIGLCALSLSAGGGMLALLGRVALVILPPHSGRTCSCTASAARYPQ